jgi:23S rRNA pseudouridine1911/1915/1917 synthase
MSETNKLEVLYEDNHLIAVNKGSSLLVQADDTGDTPLEEMVKQYIKEKYHKPGEAYLGVVHRIDRPVSGVVLFARTSKALERLNKLFSEREVKKTYWAIVKNKPDPLEATLEHYILRNQKTNKSAAYVKEVQGSKLARLSYKLLASSERYYLLEIDLETGRHHQIRCQLAHIGCPIKGDLKYGFDRSNPGGGISLHSRSLSFKHPVKGDPLMFLADPPHDPLWDAFLKMMK